MDPVTRRIELYSGFQDVHETPNTVVHRREDSIDWASSSEVICAGGKYNLNQ